MPQTAVMAYRLLNGPMPTMRFTFPALIALSLLCLTTTGSKGWLPHTGHYVGYGGQQTRISIR